MASQFTNPVGFKLNTLNSLNLFSNWSMQFDKLYHYNRLFKTFTNLLTLVKYELWYKFNNLTILNYSISWWVGQNCELNLLIYWNFRLKTLVSHHNKLLKKKKSIKKIKKKKAKKLHPIQVEMVWVYKRSLFCIYLNTWSKKITF